MLEACGDGLASFVERLKARCAAAGRKIARVILTHEAGRDGFWLARFLANGDKSYLWLAVDQEGPEFRREVQPPASLKGSIFLLAEPSLSLGNRGEGGGSEWKTRLSVEEPMLSTGLHLASESTVCPLGLMLRARTASPTLKRAGDAGGRS